MVIDNINKYSLEELKSLENKDNNIRLIIENDPDWDKVNLLKDCFVNKNTRITLVFAGDDNNVDYSQYESIKDNVVSVESYNWNYELKTISGISVFRHLEEIAIKDLYDKNIDLSELSDLDNLKELYLLYKNLTPQQHHDIGNLRNLHILTVKGLDVELLKPLEHLMELTCFALKNSKNMNLKFPNLKKLEIERASKDVDLDFLPKLEFLEILSIHGMSQIKEIPNLDHLEKLKCVLFENFKNLIKFPALSRNLEFIALVGNLSSLDINELSELTPENLTNLKEIIINLGRVAKTNLILDRFEGICKTRRLL